VRMSSPFSCWPQRLLGVRPLSPTFASPYNPADVCVVLKSAHEPNFWYALRHFVPSAAADSSAADSSPNPLLVLCALRHFVPSADNSPNPLLLCRMPLPTVPQIRSLGIWCVFVWWALRHRHRPRIRPTANSSPNPLLLFLCVFVLCAFHWHFVSSAPERTRRLTVSQFFHFTRAPFLYSFPSFLQYSLPRTLPVLSLFFSLQVPLSFNQISSQFPFFFFFDE
jgi:hypothetical protein